MSRYCGQFGRPDPFGSPLAMKLTQYEDIVAASFLSTSSHVWFACPFGLLNAYEISAVWVAPCGEGWPFSVGMRVKKYVYAFFPILACAADHCRIFQLISSAQATCAAGCVSASEVTPYNFT